MTNVVKISDFQRAAPDGEQSNILVFEQFYGFNSMVGPNGLRDLVALRDNGWILYTNSKYFPESPTSQRLVQRGNEQYMGVHGEPLFFAYNRETGRGHVKSGDEIVVDDISEIRAHAIISGIEEEKVLLLNCEEDQVRLRCDNFLHEELVTRGQLKERLGQLVRGGHLAFGNGFLVNEAPVYSMADAVAGTFAYVQSRRAELDGLLPPEL